VSFPTLCSKVVISPTITALAVNPSMVMYIDNDQRVKSQLCSYISTRIQARSSRMKTSRSSTLSLDCCPWLTLAPTPMVLNSSLPLFPALG